MQRETINYITNWIQDYRNKNKVEGLVIGVSGVYLPTTLLACIWRG